MKPAAAVFAVALVVRLLYASIAPPRTLPDSAEYLALAKNTVAHRVFSLSASAPWIPTIRRAPAYPLFLIATGGAARAVQCVLDALVAAMICAIAARRAPLRWAVAMALLYALHPGAIVYANTILSDGLFAFFLTASIALLLAGDALWLPAAAGVTLALAALTRPIGAVLFIVVAAVLLASRRFAVAAVFSAAMLLAVAPWIVRSSLLGGRFVLVTSDGPLKLAMATNAAAPWNLNDQATVWGPYLWNVDPCGSAFARARTPRQSVQADDVCLHEALDNLRRHPGYYARSRLSQLAHFPLTSFDFATGYTSTIGAAIARKEVRVVVVKSVLYALFSLAPLLLGVAGTIAAWRFLEIRLAAGVWIFTLAVHAPLFVEYRFFLPAVPMLLVCASAPQRLRRAHAAGDAAEDQQRGHVGQRQQEVELDAAVHRL